MDWDCAPISQNFTIGKQIGVWNEEIGSWSPIYVQDKLGFRADFKNFQIGNKSASVGPRGDADEAPLNLR